MSLNFTKNKSVFIDSLVYIALLTAIVVFRFHVLKYFSFNWTDGDQVLMWHGAKDFAEGKFYETRFYGQAYNTMLESLFAAPFTNFGIGIDRLLPIVTSGMAIFPFILISLHVFIKKSSKLALVILSIPLILPPNYTLITSIPRGFVTGIFVASLLYLLLENRTSKVKFFLFSFLFVISYSINPNVIYFSVPCLCYVILNNYKNKPAYLPVLIGFSVGFLIHFLLNLFYEIHENYNLHRYSVSYSFNNVWESLQNMNFYFKDISIVFVHFGISILLLLLVIVWILFIQQQKQKAISIAVFFVILLITFSMSKLQDALDSVFYSYARFYLAVPLLLALAISFLNLRKFTWLVYVYLLIPFACFAYNDSQLEPKVAAETNMGMSHMVSIKPVVEVKDECKRLKALSEKNKIDLIVIGFDWRNTLCTYGCRACVDDFPPTIFPFYERRTWRMIEDENKVYQNVLVIDVALHVDSILPNVEKLEDNFYLVKNNHLKTFELIDTIGMKYRPFR